MAISPVFFKESIVQPFQDLFFTFIRDFSNRISLDVKVQMQITLAGSHKFCKLCIGSVQDNYRSSYFAYGIDLGLLCEFLHLEIEWCCRQLWHHKQRLICLSICSWPSETLWISESNVVPMVWYLKRDSLLLLLTEDTTLIKKLDTLFQGVFTTLTDFLFFMRIISGAFGKNS